MDYENNGAALRSYKGSSIYGEKYMRMYATTWTYMTSGIMSFRYIGTGYLYNNKGPGVFTKDESVAIEMTGFMNTCVADYIQNFLNPTLTILPGNVRTIPYRITDSIEETVRDIASASIAFSKSDWDSFEISWDFKKHPMI